MILVLDIGNTNVVLGCIADGEILFTERMATDSGKTELDYAISLKMVLELREIKVSEITGAIIGSVVPPVTSLMREAIRKVTGQEALVVIWTVRITGIWICRIPSSSLFSRYPYFWASRLL